MKRMLARLHIVPLQTGNLFERFMNAHLTRPDNPPSRSNHYLDALVYVSVMVLLLAILGIFGDIP